MATKRNPSSAVEISHASPQALRGRLPDQHQPRAVKWRLTLLASCIVLAYATPDSWAATVNCNNTLYYCSWQPDDTIIVTTTVASGLSPLQGYGVYLAGGRQNTVNDITINTSGNAADGIRSTQPGVLFRANRLTINATGSSADGINLAADTNSNADALVISKNYTNISSTSGVAVRANNFQNANANSVIILSDNTVARAIAGIASNSSDSVGYAVFSGNRDRDTNGIGILGILQGQNNNTLGSSYVFIGSNSELSTTGTNAHTAYANKGGLIQLGDGTNITATGNNAYPLYAATEQQGSYASNTRPGYIFLEGGVKLRSNINNNIVMRANGAGSIIASKAMAVPEISDSFVIQSRVPGLDKNITKSTSGKFDIEGLLSAINGGEISLSMSNNSYFKGTTTIDSSSTINLNIDGPNSVWYIKDQASLSNVTISNGATLLPQRENYEIKQTTINGNVINNNGILHLAIQTNGIGTATPGDLFTINGNYSGTDGKIYFDTRLNNDSSPTDLLIINGNTSGNSTVYVNNTGGTGAPTTQGIKIIEVIGQANGTFTLNNGYTVLGAYTYRLNKEELARSNTTDWFLRSRISPTPPTPEPDPNPPVPNPPGPNPKPEPEPDPEYHVGSPAYEAYTQSLLDMNKVGTLQQRIGNRIWLTNKSSSSTLKSLDTSGIWTKLETSYIHNEPFTSTTKSDFKQHTSKLHTGIDIPINLFPEGTLIAGASVQLAKGRTRTSSINYGDGHISTDGYGLKGTLTWYDEKGLYIDAQAQTIWFRTDLKTDAPFAPSLEKNHDGFGYALSVESGKKVQINNQWSTTPQAQLVYSDVDFEHFTDGFGSRLKNNKGESLRARLGTTIDHEKIWHRDDGKQHKSHIYGIANLYYEFHQGTKINLSGVNFVSKNDRLWGGLGIGASYNSANDDYSIYGEALVDTSLNHLGKSHSARADIGLRIRW